MVQAPVERQAWQNGKPIKQRRRWKHAVQWYRMVEKKAAECNSATFFITDAPSVTLFVLAESKGYSLCCAKPCILGDRASHSTRLGLRGWKRFTELFSFRRSPGAVQYLNHDIWLQVWFYRTMMRTQAGWRLSSSKKKSGGIRRRNACQDLGIAQRKRVRIPLFHKKTELSKEVFFVSKDQFRYKMRTPKHLSSKNSGM